MLNVSGYGLRVDCPETRISQLVTFLIFIETDHCLLQYPLPDNTKPCLLTSQF